MNEGGVFQTFFPRLVGDLAQMANNNEEAPVDCVVQRRLNALIERFARESLLEVSAPVPDQVGDSIGAESR